MKSLPDKTFSLAIVDPPYGMVEDYGVGCSDGGIKGKAFVQGNIQKWDKKPPQEYFNQLFRVSKNQIIWGGNYFNLPPCRCFIAWDKIQPFPSFSAVEYAWTSFNRPSLLFRFDNRYAGKIHPTQKPVQLYIYLLTQFAKQGDTILDTHLGSGSSRIAAYNLGYDFTACEISTEYYKQQEQRFQQECHGITKLQNGKTLHQLSLFNF